MKNSDYWKKGMTLAANLTSIHRPDLFPGPWAVIIKVLFVTVSLFGIIANLKVIFMIVKSKELRTPLMILLMNLSIADAVAGLSTYPFVFVDVSKTSIRGTGANVLCTFTTAMVVFFIAACESVLTLCAISFSRFIIIKYPMKLNLKLTKRKSIIFAMTSWFVSLLLLSPNALTVRFEEDTGFCYRYYPPWMNIKLYSAITIMLGIVLPIGLMTMTYIAAWRQLWREPASNSSLHVQPRSRKKIMTMLGVLILSYMFCWAPFYIYWTMVSAFDYYKDTTKDKINLFRFYTIAALFALCNSALDPVIYTLSGGQFKIALYRMRRSNRVRTIRFAPEPTRELKDRGRPEQRLTVPKIVITENL